MLANQDFLQKSFIILRPDQRAVELEVRQLLRKSGFGTIEKLIGRPVTNSDEYLVKSFVGEKP